MAKVPFSCQRPTFMISTRVTTTFHILTWKWCATYGSTMACIYATKEANLSNRHRATGGHGKIPNNQCDLDLWPGNGARHIIPWWDVFVTHTRRIHLISTETVSRKYWMAHWHLTCKWCVSHRPSWAVFMPDMTQICTIDSGALEQTWKIFLWPVWPCKFWPENGAKFIVQSWIV